MPASSHRLGPVAEVPAGAMKRYVVDGIPIAVYNCGGALSATHDTCTHAEASLAGGVLDCEEGFVECPLHGARFDVRTGAVLSMPAVTPVKTFHVGISEDGFIYVEL